MELPFAVEPTDPIPESSLHHSESSLVTASSQGSFMDSSNLGSPLLPNTPQDVVLPPRDTRTSGQPQNLPPLPQISGAGPTVITTAPTSSQREQDEPEVIDFTYVDVSETEADTMGILMEGGNLDMQPESQRGDILTVLLSGMQLHGNEALLERTEQANEAATKATEAKKQGDLVSALEHHTQAAKLYIDNAMAIRDKNASLAKSLLLLSQTQAKSALALKGIVKLSSAELQQVFPTMDKDGKSGSRSTAMTQKDRLRAAVRGALGSHHPHEEDISDSQFLGRATTGPLPTSKSSPIVASDSSIKSENENPHDDRGTLLSEGQESSHNPVDEMMELERELRDMDMALELGNSISSLDARTQNRMRNSIVDGSFMVVPPGSNSYMSSSMWGNNHVPNNPRQAPHSNASGTAGVRARANRVQNMLDASTVPANRQLYPPQQGGTTSSRTNGGLESSWWGNTSSTSQILTSSIISLGTRAGDGNLGDLPAGQPTNTKQVMRLMDSLKTLGDENAALLREVEEAEAARQEAKAAREEIKKFQETYHARFTALKTALKKYAKDYPQMKGSIDHPVGTSDFHKSASTADQLQRQEQLIRKLTADLKKEKEESKKKDQALRKYENFYREVKARSAQKAAQKTQQQRQHKAGRKVSSGTPR